MKLQIGKGLFRIFIIFYVGWVIYHPFKYYNDYVGYIDAQTAWWKNDKEFNLKYAKGITVSASITNIHTTILR